MAPPEQFAAPFKNRRGGAVTRAAFLGGFCFLLKREALESAGALDERFIWGWEDMDYCLRLRQAGWELGLCRGVFVRHDGSRTLRGKALRWREKTDRLNRSLIARKWQGPDLACVSLDGLRDIFGKMPTPWDRTNLGVSVLILGPGPGRIAALNEAARRAREEFLLIREEGVELPQRGLRRMLAAIKREENLSVVGAGTRPGPVAHVPSGCVLVRRRMLLRAGNFDEALDWELAWADFCARVLQAGHQIAALKGIPGKRGAPPVSVVLLGKNGKDLPSRVKALKGSCGVRSCEWLGARPNGRKDSWARELNAAISRARGEHIVFLSEGAIPVPGWLRGLAAAARWAPNVGAAAPAREPGRGTRPVERVDADCVLLPRSVIRRIGLFDERFEGCGAWSDYQLRLLSEGFQIVETAAARVGRRPAAGERRAQDSAMLLSKWAGHPLLLNSLRR
jgi:GT2 family glycosyltransferase